MRWVLACGWCCALSACGARTELDRLHAGFADVVPVDAASVDAASVDAGEVRNGCYTAIEAGSTFACALRSDGGLYCWGNTIFLRLGDRSVVAPTRVPGIDPVIALSVGGAYVLATTEAGLFSFGQNNFGQLGLGNGLVNVSTPTRVDTFDGELRAISAGGTHGCAIDGDDRLRCWGNHGWGEGGIGSPDPVTLDRPAFVVGDARYVAVAAGDVHTCAVTIDDALYCWGGRSSEPSYPSPGPFSPVFVADMPSPVSRMSAGEEFTCAVGADTVVRCWGKNGYAVLGDGTQVHHATPRPIVGAGDVGFADVACGWLHACAAALDGSVFCWGSNWRTSLGANPDCNDDLVCTPARVPGVEGHAIRVAVGTHFSCALTREGEVWCWGSQEFAQLGVIHDDPEDSPIPQRINLPCP